MVTLLKQVYLGKTALNIINIKCIFDFQQDSF